VQIQSGEEGGGLNGRHFELPRIRLTVCVCAHYGSMGAGLDWWSMTFILIGAILSEPHIDEFAVNFP